MHSTLYACANYLHNYIKKFHNIAVFSLEVFSLEVFISRKYLAYSFFESRYAFPCRCSTDLHFLSECSCSSTARKLFIRKFFLVDFERNISIIQYKFTHTVHVQVFIHVLVDVVSAYDGPHIALPGHDNSHAKVYD